MVSVSARGRAQADAQGRGDDGAGSEESGGEKPSDCGGAATRGFSVFLSHSFLWWSLGGAEALGWGTRKTAGR